jgi:predicted house-cleaning noncanonical NTP pyrophosphatase (MazG superfamily)
MTSHHPGGPGKLVRDHIPHLIRATGATPVIRVASPTEYTTYLRAKLTEEVREYLDAPGDPAELADILEVIHALAEDLDVTPARLDQLRDDKATERGRFTCRYIWYGNTTQDPPR